MASDRVTIKDIAKNLNTSVGSVSKALSGKPGISKKRREEIIQASKRMGYNVNRLAQCLARKPICIAIVYPYVWKQYYNDVIIGMNEAFDHLRDYNVVGRFVQYSDIYSEYELYKICDSLLKDEVDAIILCPASITTCKLCLQNLKMNQIPVFLLGNDFDPDDRTGCVRVNAYMAGRLAAELLCYMTPPESNLIIFLGDASILEHNEKVKGFRHQLSGRHYLLREYETHDEPAIATLLTKKVLNEVPNIQGIYVATGNSLSICDVLREEKREQEIKVIATDLYDTMVPYVKDKTIDAVIYQYPKEQGQQVVMQCYQYLVEQTIGTSQILIDPRAVFGSNL